MEKNLKQIEEKRERASPGTLLVEDESGIWWQMTKVSIFSSAKYETESKEELRADNDGPEPMKLIAPGVKNSYHFCIKNVGETMLKYRVSFRQEESPCKLPLEIRLKCEERYLLGEDTAWEPMEKIEKAPYEGYLKEKSSTNYTLEWRWPFEKDDSYDTYLGNLAVKELLEEKLTIYVEGEECVQEEPAPEQPMDHKEPVMIADRQMPKTGDTSKPLLWGIVLALSTLLLALIIFIKRKKERISIPQVIQKMCRIMFAICLFILLGCSSYLLLSRLLYRESYPQLFGYSAAVVVSGSMEHTIEIKDLIIIHRQQEYEIGDIITYKNKNHLVTHRIIGKSMDGFQTKGDANNVADLEPAPEENVLGKVIYVIPKVGWFIEIVKTPFRFLENLTNPEL